MRKLLRTVGFAAAFALVGCSSMRVAGIVTDAATKEGVGTCEITIDPHYAHSDPAGHYSIAARRCTEEGSGLKHLNCARSMKLVCRGYETKTVPIDTSKTRSPKLNIEVTPVATAAKAPCECKCPR